LRAEWTDEGITTDIASSGEGDDESGGD